MLELFFLMFLLTQNLFWALGVLTFTALCAYMVYCAFWTASYRLFSSYWWMEVISGYTYTHPIIHSYQRLKHGCSDHDAWGFDTFLLNILPVGLKRVRDNYFSETDISEKDWNDMIGGIEAYRHIYRCSYRPGQCPYSHLKLTEDFSHAMWLLTRHFNKLWI